MSRSVLIACLLLVSAPAAAAPGWRADGTPVARDVVAQSHPVVVSDGSGGAYVAWDEGAVHVQHVLSNGAIAAGWPGAGVPMPGYDPSLCVDGGAGVFLVTHSYYSLHHFHLAADLFASGIEGPREGNDGVPSQRFGPLAAAKAPRLFFPTLFPADSGRAYVVWEYDRAPGSVVGRLMPDGGRDSTFVWGKSLDPGRYVTWNVAGCPDDSGGLFLAWVGYDEGAGTDVFAGHVSRTGAVSAGWTAAEAPVCRAPGDQDAVGIAADGMGGAMVVWLDARFGPGRRLFAQHLTAAGAPAPGWPVDGLQVSSYLSQAGLERTEDGITEHWSSVVSDGAGGLYVAWSVDLGDGGDIVCLRLQPDGQRAPGWPADGLLLSNALGVQDQPTIAADGTGGAIVTWHDGRTAESGIYAARIMADGTLAAGWPYGGLRISGGPGTRQNPRLAVVGNGAIIAWEDDRCGSGRILASRVGIDGSIVTVPTDTTLAVAFHDEQIGAGSMRLTWNVSGTDTPPVVERRGSGSDWVSLGRAAFDADDRVFIRDDSTFAGCAYSFRLGLERCGDTTLVWMGEIALNAPIGPGFRTITSELRGEWMRTSGPGLYWQLSSGPLDSVVVERAVGSGALVRIGRLVPDAARSVVYNDSTTVPGTLYRYRLRMSTCGHDELSAIEPVWTPGSPIPPPGSRPAVYANLTLGPPSPNPVAGVIWVSYALANPAPATLEVFDSLGRMRQSRRIADLSPGAHLAELGTTEALGPGVYWVRLRQNSETRIARFSVVR